MASPVADGVSSVELNRRALLDIILMWHRIWHHYEQIKAVCSLKYWCYLFAHSNLALAYPVSTVHNKSNYTYVYLLRHRRKAWNFALYSSNISITDNYFILFLAAKCFSSPLISLSQLLLGRTAKLAKMLSNRHKRYSYGLLL